MQPDSDQKEAAGCRLACLIDVVGDLESARLEVRSLLWRGRGQPPDVGDKGQHDYQIWWSAAQYRRDLEKVSERVLDAEEK